MTSKLTAREKERRRRERWECNFVYRPSKPVQAKPSRKRVPPAHRLRPLADAETEQQLRAWLEARRRRGYLPPVTHPDTHWATQ